MSQASLADVTQARWAKACERLGLLVERGRGKGGHYLVTHPITGAKFTVQSTLWKQVNIKIFKRLQAWGFSEEEIFKVL